MYHEVLTYDDTVYRCYLGPCANSKIEATHSKRPIVVIIGFPKQEKGCCTVLG